MLLSVIAAILIGGQDALVVAVPTNSEINSWTGSQVRWLNVPRPDRHLRLERIPSNVRYLANFDCRISERGRLEQCVLISEAPNDIGFARAAERGIRSARIELDPSSAQAGDRLAFSVTFRLDE